MADCCVCLEPLKNELVQMKHCCKKWLHYECLKRSIAKSSGSCPFCRKRILTWFRKTPRAELISVPTERSLLKQSDEGTIFPVFTFIRLTILQFNPFYLPETQVVRKLASDGEIGKDFMNAKKKVC